MNRPDDALPDDDAGCLRWLLGAAALLVLGVGYILYRILT